MIDVTYRNLDELRPYEKNPRKNKRAVDRVASSIREFGFKVPMVIDKDNVIVTGHTRLEAAKKLGIVEVPCIIADDLTPEQVKAFRLADNKVSEFSKWDFKLLDEEIADLSKWFDMSEFGFAEPQERENERHRTDDAYNLGLFNALYTEGFYQMPVIKGTNMIPRKLIGFNYVKSSTEFDAGVHFFIDDYQFERTWNDTAGSVKRLKKFDVVLSPDFSLYLDMPIAMQIWNVYRSRLVGQVMERDGIPVIPTVSWSTKESFVFCFDGLPKGKTLAVSTVGVKRSDEALGVYREGISEMVKRLKPKQILLYGGMVEAGYGDAKIIEFKNEVTERMKNGGR